MQPPSKVRRVIGWVLSGLLSALWTFSAIGKLSANPSVTKMMTAWGLGDWVLIIGLGELISTVLFLIPKTAVLGTLLLSSYMGGAIVTHMQNGEDFTSAAIILLVLWTAAALRMPELHRRLTARPAPTTGS